MTTEFRKTGLAAVGDMPWGTHFCHFYQTQQDLFDIVVPYLKAGLENNEFCLWITAEPLSQETSNAFRRVIPGADRYLAAGDIEIFSSMQWYLKDGIFDPQRVTNGWNVKLAQALAKGYAGLRVAADEAWLGKKYWKAFKFTAQGEIRIGCRVRDGRLLTSVTDTGMGIKPEDLDKLFTTFWQLDCTLARQHEGTGLGLAICKRLADLLGGEIWVESQWEGGSTFTFVLPHND